MRNLLLKLLACFRVIGVVALNTMPAYAGSELMTHLDALRNNGTITQEQYERLRPDAIGKPVQSRHEADRGERLRLAISETVQPAMDKAQAASNHGKTSGNVHVVNVVTDGGLKVMSADEEFEFKLGGRLRIDATSYSQDKTALGSGTELRSARLSVDGKMFKDWGYVVKYDFAENKVKVKDAYIAYNGFNRTLVKLGNFKAPFSLGNMTTAIFMEDAQVVDALPPGRRIGAGLARYGDKWSAAGAVFGEGVGDDVANEGDEGWGMAARATYAPVLDEKWLVHLGASMAYKKINDERKLKFDPAPESNLAKTSLVNTGTISNVSHSSSYALEGAAIWGTVTVQSEYICTNIDRDTGGSSLQFNGWHVSGSWLLTGETRKYEAVNKTFRRVKPASKLGAWELNLRFSSIDLNDADIRGGAQDNLTFGLNWYVNSTLRFMANYALVKADPNKDGIADKPNIFQIRGQVDF